MYIVKHFKIFISGTKRPMILNLDMQHRGLKFCKIIIWKTQGVCINGDPGLTLNYLAARSNLVTCPFEEGKLLESDLLGKTCRT